MSTEASRRARKRWPVVVAALAIFLGGFVAGTYVGFKVLRDPFLWLGAVGQSYMAGEYSRLQYHEAAYPEAKEALQKYLRYLESTQASSSHWKPGQNPWLDERGLAQDKAMTLARLALLEERNAHVNAAELAWSKAEAQLALAKWMTPSREKLRSLVERLDQSTYRTPATPNPAQGK